MYLERRETNYELSIYKNNIYGLNIYFCQGRNNNNNNNYYYYYVINAFTPEV